MAADSNDRYVKVIELEDEFEAGLISTELDRENIPHKINSYFDKAYDGVFQFQYGWGYLSAPQKFENEIREIYTDLKNSRELDEDDS